MKKISKLFLSIVVGVAATAGLAQAQIGYSGGTYGENFDSMGSAGTTTPTGWFVGTGTGAFNTGTTVVVSFGGATTSGNFNLGTAGDGDRALGSLAASSIQRDTELDITNNLGASMVQFTISYDGEQWRSGGTGQVANTLTLQLSVDGTTWSNLGSGFNFTSPQVGQTAGALDGNAAANRTAGIGGTFILGTPIADGSTFYLRWADPDDASSDASLGIDNFNFSASAIPEPSAWAMIIAGVGLLAGVQRFRRKQS